MAVVGIDFGTLHSKVSIVDGDGDEHQGRAH